MPRAKKTNTQPARQPGSYIINTRLAPNTVRQLDEIAASVGLTRSDVTRIAITQGLLSAAQLLQTRKPE